MKSTLLHLFDVGSPSRMTMKEKQDAFRTLQKLLAAEMRAEVGSGIKPMLDATVKALDAVLKSPELKTSFVTALLQRTPFSCALFRYRIIGSELAMLSISGNCLSRSVFAS